MAARQAVRRAGAAGTAGTAARRGLRPGGKGFDAGAEAAQAGPGEDGQRAAPVTHALRRDAGAERGDEAGEAEQEAGRCGGGGRHSR